MRRQHEERATLMQGEVIPVVYCAHPLQIPSWVFWCAFVPGVGGQRSEGIVPRWPSGEACTCAPRAPRSDAVVLELAMRLQEGALRARKGRGE